MKSAVFLAAALSCGVLAAARTYEWDGGAGTGLLTDPLNWSGDTVPSDATDETAVIKARADGPLALSLGGEFRVATLKIESDAAAPQPVGLDLSDGTLVVTNALSWTRGVLLYGTDLRVSGGTFPAVRVVLQDADPPAAPASFSASNAFVDVANWTTDRAYSGYAVRLTGATASKLPFFGGGSAIALERSAVLNPSWGNYRTNSLLHLRDGSVVSNMTGTIAVSNTRIVLEGGSTFHGIFGGAGGLHLARRGNPGGNVLAATNAFIDVRTLTMAGTNDCVRLHRSTFAPDSAGTLHLNGFGNALHVTGDGFAFTNTHIVKCGTGTSVTVGEGVDAVMKTIDLSQPATNCVFRFEPGSFTRLPMIAARGRSTDADLTCGNLVEVRSNAVLSLEVMNYESGLNGCGNVLRIAGEMRVDKYVHVGCLESATDVRVELCGDAARFRSGCSIGGSTGHLTVGNAANPEAVTLSFRPGRGAFNGEAPFSLVSGDIVLDSARIEVHLEELVDAGGTVSLPLMKAPGWHTIKNADLAALNAALTVTPAGRVEDAALSIDSGNKTLLFTARIRRGFAVVIR